MVEQHTRDRVDAFWSSTLCTDTAELHASGVRVRVNPPSRMDWRGIYVLAFEGVTIYAPADHVEKITAAIAAFAPDELLEAKTWQAILGGAAQAIFGPVRHFYLDRADALGPLAQGRRLNPTDSDALGVLRSALPAQEWLVTGFTGQPAVIFGILEGDALVAAANLTPGPDAATDIGLVIHPDARGRGYGTGIAALAAKQAIAMHGVARYRALTSSPSTVAIADRLGFEEYGRNLVAYLSDQTVAMDQPAPVI